MAAPMILTSKHSLDDTSFPTRKRFKTSELPLNSAQRSSIDGILHTIKKKGEYDTFRKQVWSQFMESEEKMAFTKSLNELAEAEIDRDPSLLSRDRGKAATLMQGAVDRSDIYKDIEKALDDLISRNISNIIKSGRDIRVAEVGEEVAREEEKRGSRTDEQYDQELAAKKQERARIRKQEETRKRREEEKEALRAKEAEKLKELEKLRSQDERRKEREAVRAAKEAEFGRRKRKIVPNNEHERNNDIDAEREQNNDLPVESPTAVVPPVDEKALEEAALALLLQEGREAAAKNAPKPELEISESPHRRPHISPPKGPAAMRARDVTKPKLAFSAGPTYQGSPFQQPLSARSRSRSPYRKDRSRSNSLSRRRSYSIRDDDPGREFESEAQSASRVQSRTQYRSEAEPFHSREEDEYYERRGSRTVDADAIRDRSERGSKYDHDYDQKDRRESHSHRHGDRPRDRGRYEDRPSFKRVPREEAPEHIDRYVPGGARPRDKDKDRPRDEKERDAPREPRRERNSYHDTNRERHHYTKESEDGRSDYRESHHRHDRGRDRERERGRDQDGYRERVRHGHGEHAHVRPRTDEPPEHIDRYVPGK